MPRSRPRLRCLAAGALASPVALRLLWRWAWHGTPGARCPLCGERTGDRLCQHLDIAHVPAELEEYLREANR